jgi:hypothetical protein
MNLKERVKDILLSPQTEWPVIDTEPTTPAELYKQYIVPLAAIGPVAQLLGWLVFGVHGYRPPIVSALATTLVQYVLTLAGTYVLALIIDALAPTFNGKKNLLQALKVTAYSMTAAWIAGIFALIPPLTPLTILGLYSVYLLYLGLPILMKTPRDKALVYTGVVLIAAIVVSVLVGTLSYCFLPVSSAGMGVSW